MLYNQPFGISDPNAAYINGNPTTGTMGSIPPAASIEYDQREIVAVIKWAADHGYHDYANALCQQPSNADLTQLLKAIFGIMNSTRLTAPQTYYVNTATGNDSNDGLTAGTPFKTLQHAAYQATVFNLNGFSVQVIVADGTYGQVSLPPVNGSGVVRFTGNVAVPANCKIHANTGAAVAAAGGPYIFEGFRFESDAPLPATGAPGAGVWSLPGGNIQIGQATSSNEFGNCADAHIVLAHGTAVGVGSIRVAGNARYHISADQTSNYYNSGPSSNLTTLTITQAVTITSAFVYSVGGSSVKAGYAGGINGAALVTGPKFIAATNGTIDTGGAGVNYLPGTVAGSLYTGGQYA